MTKQQKLKAIAQTTQTVETLIKTLDPSADLRVNQTHIKCLKLRKFFTEPLLADYEVMYRAASDIRSFILTCITSVFGYNSGFSHRTYRSYKLIDDLTNYIDAMGTQ